ncbi:hypothetical protein GOBAR_AA37728 [Gossypium barbadense]|uniref:Uncharacterized protein n=1 Tax=Gossypium barbadense TaxID=3634 RepID=A0A2P5VVX6_GOSBA|nr:hypothetical protein GOBAR_AA37728 [Gossypium barbadense]
MNSELRELPAVELSTLAIILKTVTESGIADQMWLTELILNDFSIRWLTASHLTIDNVARFLPEADGAIQNL